MSHNEVVRRAADLADAIANLELEVFGDHVSLGQLREICAGAFLVNRRYCGLCDEWVPGRQTVCRQCGADTDRPMKGTADAHV